MRRQAPNRLSLAREQALAQRHPLAMWADYWHASSRVSELSIEQAQAFLARWPGTYVQDRFRNDWLLELGRRREWAAMEAELGQFKMNDDREVACYALLLQAARGYDVREAARAAWLAQPEADNGCALMAESLLRARHFDSEDAWHRARVSMDAGKTAAARQAAALAAPGAAQLFDSLLESPQSFLQHRTGAATRTDAQLATLALVRLAAQDFQTAAALMEQRWDRQLPADLASWAWAAIGRQAAFRLSPAASDYYQLAARGANEASWSEEMLSWRARAALRTGQWRQVRDAINAMPATMQRQAVWVYWKAKALLAMSGQSGDGEAFRAAAIDLLGTIAGNLDFYGMLAQEDLGRTLVVPARPAAPTAQEITAARAIPGIDRALRLFELGLRSEAMREWNWTLSFGLGRRMTDRELLAAAEVACQARLWDRCINTSERTVEQVDFGQRFPTPFREEVLQAARQRKVDPAYVYGLIRQESRFIVDARSGVGASGLMQVMPDTARWLARKIGLPYSPQMLGDRDTNILLGTSYLQMVLDDFGGSQAVAAAAYNAGPSRARRWSQSPAIDAAIWVENIPFLETRDYVKKVLVNATWYEAVLGRSTSAVSLRGRLGERIGSQ